MIPQPNDGFAWVQASGGAGTSVPSRWQPLRDHFFTTRPWRLGSPAPDANGQWMGRGGLGAWRRSGRPGAPPPGSRRDLRRRPRAGARAPLPPADIQVTRDPAIAMAVQTADCLPILFADAREQAPCAPRMPGGVVLLRACRRLPWGRWCSSSARGRRISSLRLADRFGACCYEVGVDVHEALRAAGFGDGELPRWFFDAPQPTAVTLRCPQCRARGGRTTGFSTGGRRRAISLNAPACRRIALTSPRSAREPPGSFCSYRRDGKPAGRMAGAIRAQRTQRNGKTARRRSQS